MYPDNTQQPGNQPQPSNLPPGQVPMASPPITDQGTSPVPDIAPIPPIPTQMPPQPQDLITTTAQQQAAQIPNIPSGMPNAQTPPNTGPVTPQKANPNSTQNTLEIAEIRDGIVIMNDGSFRAVVMARSINFDLMSAQEREAVEFSYQNFLNSLYFDIQIVIRSRKVDMRPYLEKLNKIRSEQDNMLLAMLMEDYIYYISQLVEQTNIMNKQFYVVVPYFTTVDTKHMLGDTKTLMSGVASNKKKGRLVINEATLTKAKTELQNRVQSVMSGLMQLGVQAAPLDTKELIELYYDVYNPDTATRQPLGSFEDLAGVVVSKGEGQAAQPNLNRGMM